MSERSKDNCLKRQADAAKSVANFPTSAGFQSTNLNLEATAERCRLRIVCLPVGGVILVFME